MRADIRQEGSASKHLKCFLDGYDISDDCFAADEEKGLALCYRRLGSRLISDESGKLIIVRRTGKVELRFEDWVSPKKRETVKEILSRLEDIETYAR
jgi:hypothetical protein